MGLLLSLLCAFAMLCARASATVRPAGIDELDWLVYENETVFGVEFGLQRVTMAALLANTTTIPLASVQGNEAYIGLLQKYLDVSIDVATTQQPPSGILSPVQAEEQWPCSVSGLQPQTSWYDWFQVRILKQPKHTLTSVDCDNYYGDPEVAVLAHVVEQASNASVALLKELGVNMSTVPLRAYAEVVAPSFLYTTIRPFERDDFETHPGYWYWDITAKLSAAVHRAGFRRSVSTSPGEILRNHNVGIRVPSAPSTAVKAAKLDQCFSANALVEESCWLRRNKTDVSDLVIVVERNGRSLSLWVEAVNKPPMSACSVFTPWSTYLDLGTEWDTLIAPIHTLMEEARTQCRKFNPAIRALLIGDSWDEESTAAFSGALSILENDIHMVDEGAPAVFAASIGAAETARNLVTTAHSCTLGWEVDWDEVRAIKDGQMLPRGEGKELQRRPYGMIKWRQASPLAKPSQAYLSS